MNYENNRTLGERLKYIENISTLNQGEFANKLGVSVQTLINYEKDRRDPPANFILNVCRIFFVGPSWLLMGEGEPFIQKGGDAKTSEAAKVVAIDAAVQLLREAEEETGISLNSAQRQAVLPILRKSLAEDRRTVKELIQSMYGGKESG